MLRTWTNNTYKNLLGIEVVWEECDKHISNNSGGNTLEEGFCVSWYVKKT